MQFAVEFVDFLLVVDSLQRGGGHGAVERTRATEDVGNFLAQAYTGMHRPDQRTQANATKAPSTV